MVDPHSVHRLLSGRRAGVSLVEVLVALGIVAVLGMLAYPVILDRLNVKRAEAVVSELRAYQRAITTFQTDVRRYPSKLTYLSILEDSSGIRDACGTLISALNQSRYRGPYVNRHISPIKPYAPSQNTRFTIATDDSVESVLTRTTIPTAGGGTQQVLQITVIGPNQEATRLIDSTVDGSVNNADGTVRYTSLLAAQNRINWVFTISAGDC
jgi:prepilin-type N-terminal cleavage/methylation domain-containing protein